MNIRLSDEFIVPELETNHKLKFNISNFEIHEFPCQQYLSFQYLNATDLAKFEENIPHFLQDPRSLPSFEGEVQLHLPAVRKRDWKQVLRRYHVTAAEQRDVT